MNDKLETARASLAMAEAGIKKLCDEIKEEFGKKSHSIVCEIVRLMHEAGVTNEDLFRIAKPEPGKAERNVEGLIIRSVYNGLRLTHLGIPRSVSGFVIEAGDIKVEKFGIDVDLSGGDPNGLAKKAVMKLRTLAVFLDALPTLFSMLAKEADEKRAALPDTKYARGVLDALKAIK